MSTIKIRPRTKDDLADIWDYIAEDSEARADAFLESIEDKLKLLAENPRMGRLRDELVDKLRSWLIIRPYIVFYFPLSDGVEVIRILHGSRDIDSLLLEDDFF